MTLAPVCDEGVLEWWPERAEAAGILTAGWGWVVDAGAALGAPALKPPVSCTWPWSCVLRCTAQLRADHARPSAASAQPHAAAEKGGC